MLLIDNIRNFTIEEIIQLSIYIISFIFIYQSFGWRGLLLIIPILLIKFKYNWKPANLISQNDKKWLYTLDKHIGDEYEIIETRFYNLIQEWKEFKSSNINKNIPDFIRHNKYYNDLANDHQTLISQIFKSWSLSTQSKEEDNYLQNIYNNLNERYYFIIQQLKVDEG